MTDTPATPEIGSATRPDGTTLRTLHWPVIGEPWAVALIVHGLGEHAGRYQEVAEPFANAGIDTFGYDHRGFGGSSGVPAYVDSFDQFYGDLASRIDAAHAARPGLPLVVFAHSLGGLIATGYVLPPAGKPMPDLLVLSAPGIKANLPGWKKTLARTLRSIAPKMRLANGLPEGGLSSDPAIRAQADADPLNSSTSTTRFAACAFDEQDRLQALLPTTKSMPMPTHVIHGDADPIVPLETTDPFTQMTNATRTVHTGLRHECYHEATHAEVVAEVIGWIRSQVPAKG